MRRVTLAYGAWLAFVFAAAFVAMEWYRHIEQIGWDEVARKLREQDDDLAADGADK